MGLERLSNLILLVTNWRKVLKADLTDGKNMCSCLHQTSLVMIRSLFSLITLLYFGTLLFGLLKVEKSYS